METDYDYCYGFGPCPTPRPENFLFGLDEGAWGTFERNMCIRLLSVGMIDCLGYRYAYAGLRRKTPATGKRAPYPLAIAAPTE